MAPEEEDGEEEEEEEEKKKQGEVCFSSICSLLPTLKSKKSKAYQCGKKGDEAEGNNEEDNNNISSSPFLS